MEAALPKLDPQSIVPEPTGEMPPGFEAAAAGRVVRLVSAAMGLTDFVVTHVTVPPGRWSAQRHWHEGEDEIAIILSGEAVLVDSNGKQMLHAGGIAVFPKGNPDAHHLVNESDAPFTVLALSRPEASPAHYPDIGMRYVPGEGVTKE